MRRTKEDAEKTRAAILNAAEQLFLERGVAHTSLEHIARAAGVTRGAVYWHFQNKADLFTAMLNQVRLPPEQIAEKLSADPQLSLGSLRDMCASAAATDSVSAPGSDGSIRSGIAAAVSCRRRLASLRRQVLAA